ncbi:hypothetical protein HK100_009345, partial [Physocladia obscura]
MQATESGHKSTHTSSVNLAATKTGSRPASAKKDGATIPAPGTTSNRTSVAKTDRAPSAKAERAPSAKGERAPSASANKDNSTKDNNNNNNNKDKDASKTDGAKTQTPNKKKFITYKNLLMQETEVKLVRLENQQQQQQQYQPNIARVGNLVTPKKAKPSGSEHNFPLSPPRLLNAPPTPTSQARNINSNTSGNNSSTNSIFITSTGLSAPPSLSTPIPQAAFPFQFPVPAPGFAVDTSVAMLITTMHHSLVERNAVIKHLQARLDAAGFNPFEPQGKQLVSTVDALRSENNELFSHLSADSRLEHLVTMLAAARTENLMLRCRLQETEQLAAS